MAKSCFGPEESPIKRMESRFSRFRRGREKAGQPSVNQWEAKEKTGHGAYGVGRCGRSALKNG